MREWRLRNRNEAMIQNRKDSKIYREKHPEKVAARKRIYVELRSGRIKKGVCTCGSKYVEAHHNDYTLPLEVGWFCKTHHPNSKKKLSTI